MHCTCRDACHAPASCLLKRLCCHQVALLRVVLELAGIKNAFRMQLVEGSAGAEYMFRVAAV